MILYVKCTTRGSLGASTESQQHKSTPTQALDTYTSVRALLGHVVI